MTSILLPWFVEVGLISWRTVRRDARAPLPSELLATAVIFGTFSVVGNSYPQLGATLGWGMVIATALNLTPETVAPRSGNRTSPNSPTPSQRLVPGQDYGRPFNPLYPGPVLR